MLALEKPGLQGRLSYKDIKTCHSPGTMPQPFLATFGFDIASGISAADRSNIVNTIQAELQKPNRQFQRRLNDTWLIRFNDGGFNAFIQQMDALRAQHQGTFRYLSVGWNAMIPVVLNPTGPVAQPLTKSLVALPLTSTDFTVSPPSEDADGEVPANDRPARRRAAGTRQPSNVRKGKRANGSAKPKPKPQRKPRGRSR
jgi:hypothetical protein